MQQSGESGRGALRAAPSALARLLADQAARLTRPFADQSFSLPSILVVEDGGADHRSLRGHLVALDTGGHSHPPVAESLPSAESVAALYRLVDERQGPEDGGVLLAAPADLLASIALLEDGPAVRAVAAFAPDPAVRPRDQLDLALRRNLFDAGLVGLGSVSLKGVTLDIFLASDAVRAPRSLGGGSNGPITMSSLGRNGRFGNQLFQYAFMKLYALRYGAQLGLPDWPGKQLFRLNDPSIGKTALPQMDFQGFENKELALWTDRYPVLGVDFWGYFQEIPSCWRLHRPLLATIFQLPAREGMTLDSWKSEVTEGGRRALVAIHVRRTDYAMLTIPQFRMAPEAWYVDWLKEIWPTLPDPLLYVATDDPVQVLPHFEAFSPLTVRNLPRSALPEHILDFEAIRRADWLALCNSSFSRMAAILAPRRQRCFVPSFSDARFVPFDPWDGELFWKRFEQPETRQQMRAAVPARQAEALTAVKVAFGDTGRSLYFDVTDLLSHLSTHSTISGIQRVQCELIRNSKDEASGSDVNFTVFAAGTLAIISKSALLDIVEGIHAHSLPPAELRTRIASVLERTVSADAQEGDLFLATGAFWSVKGIGRLIIQLKDRGVRAGVFVHDILPISRPEYFETNSGKALVQPVVDVLALADFAITSSRYNKRAIRAYRAGNRLPEIPIDVAPFGHGLTRVATTPGDNGKTVAAVLASPFVLCVGTIEVRKNPAYLLNIWRLMLEANRQNIPTLVLAGRRGWMANDFFAQLAATDHLDGRIVLLHDLSDEIVDELYRKCLLTMFPSFDEGWGLPVGESLAHGKICLASTAGGVPEVGESWADPIDPYDARDGYDRLVHYLDHPDQRRRREAQIAAGFVPRPWSEHAALVLRSATAQLTAAPRIGGSAAVALPANEFLPIHSGIQDSARRATAGYLSAESACICGWGTVDAVGLAAVAPVATLRFRAGRRQARITLILRLHASGSRQCRLLIQTGCGMRRGVTIKPGSNLVVTLGCESDEDGLVTASLEQRDDSRRNPSTRPTWRLRGLLYIQPAELADRPSQPGSGDRPTAARVAASDSGTLLKAERASAGRAVDSVEAFIATPNSRWQSASTVTCYRREPILLDAGDRRLFMTRYRNAGSARIGALRDDISFNRLSNPYAAMSRSVEGVLIDARGVAKDHGYLVGTEEPPPWLTRKDAAHWIDRTVLAGAKRMEGTYVMFFNGNLQNYYHWMAEGILALDLIVTSVGSRLDLRIVLPRTMDIAAVFDHRASLAALGFGALPVVEAPPPMIRVDEAIWLDDSDFVESIPAAAVRRFQRRVSALFADRRGTTRKRLLIKRLGAARAIANFDAVERFLHPLGFETVWLDGKTIEEQVLLFQQAEFVAGAHGAGLTNLLFCNPGTKVIEFMPTTEMRPFFWIISEKLGLRHAMQFCESADGAGFQAPMLVDIDRLEQIYHLTDRLEP